MNHQKILVVDDDPLISRTLVDLLRVQGYEVDRVDCGKDGLAYVKEKHPDLVLLDLVMPDMDGFEVARRIRAETSGSSVAVVMITGRDVPREKTTALEAGADDLLSKPICIPELLARVRSALNAKSHRDQLEDERSYLALEVARQTAALRKAFDESSAASKEIIRRLAKAAEFRDDDTGAHVERVSRYAEVIASAMGRSESDCQLLRLAATMHDVGKIGVPDEILRTPGGLTEDERQVMERHAEIGAQILHGSSIELIQLAEVIARSHHEWWNGEGYPDKLKGESIPRDARIVGVADALDAMTSSRLYRPTLNLNEAFDEIKGMSGRQFDPAVVKASLSVVERLREIMRKYPGQD
jgi:putative two-component system response regulator